MGSGITTRRCGSMRARQRHQGIEGNALIGYMRVLWASLLILCASVAHAESLLRVERIDAAAFERTPEALRALADPKITLPMVDPLQMRVQRGDPRIWRIRLEPGMQAPTQWLLSIHNSFDCDVDVYFPPDYVAQRFNLMRSTTNSEHSRFALALALPDDIRVGDAFFVDVQSPKAASLELRLRERVEYARHDLNMVRVHSAVISVMLSCCAVALCFFFVLRERVWLLFMGYTLASIGFVVSRTGELIAITGFVGLDRYIWQMATVFSFLQASILCFFACEFAKLGENTPKLDRTLRFFGTILLIFGALALAPAVSASKWLPGMANTLALLTIPISVVACLLSGRQGVRAAWFYLGAILPSTAAFVLIVTHLNGEIRGGSTWVTVVFLGSHAFAAITLTAGMADQVLSYRKQRDLALDDANRDPLTGVWNRRAFDRMLDRLMGPAASARNALTVCVLDLDFFKRVNDQFGHAVGDDALRFLVREVLCELRGGEFIARLGGEEFAVVLPNTGLTEGALIAERIRKRVEAHGKQISSQPLNLTVSIGVATSSDPGEQPQSLVAQADLALYQAKSLGRNRVATTSPAHSIEQSAVGTP